jgi:hypothetical protein
MLANKFESKFQSLYALIEQNVMNRLDDSPVGVPSATRLKKVMEGGFAGFKQTMPPGAVESLYDGNVGDASVTLPPVGGAFLRALSHDGFSHIDVRRSWISFAAGKVAKCLGSECLCGKHCTSWGRSIFSRGDAGHISGAEKQPSIDCHLWHK